MPAANYEESDPDNSTQPAPRRQSWVSEPASPSPADDDSSNSKPTLEVTPEEADNTPDGAGTPPVLTEEEISEFKEAFQLFDEDGDGNITIDELRKVMYGLGQRPSEAELKAMIDEVDEDGGGEIDLGEFTIMMIKQMQGIDEDALARDAFKAFDKNKDGVVDEEDIISMGPELRELVGIDLSKDEVRQMLLVADQNGDGEFDFEEFKAMMLGE